MNHRMFLRRVLLALLLVVPALSVAQTGQGPIETSQTHIRLAGAAYRDGDFARFVSELETAHALNPASLSTRYNLACGYALLGEREKSLALLDELARQGADFGMAADPDLGSLIGSEPFEAIVRRLAETTSPRITSETHVTFEQYGLIPEGITRDPRSGRLFFGSMRTGEVYAVDTEGAISRFSSVDRQNRLSVVGLTVDTDNDLLWATGSAFELAENHAADDPATSGLFGIDLETGDVVRTLPVAHDGDWLNDVVVSDDGRLFATGSGLLVSDSDTGKLERLPTSIEVFGSNGITFAGDGQTLLVASYPAGLYAVDADTGAARRLEPPENVTLYGLDGLYWHGGALIAIQNGVNPWRLIRIHLDAGLQRITDVEILERGSPATTPMTGAIDGDVIYYVGETEPPDDTPSQFPEEMQQNRGAVTIRRAPLRID